MKIWSRISILTVFLFLNATAIGFTFDSGSSRIFPTDKVSVYQDGKVIGEFTKEVPLVEDKFLSCKGKCGIKMDNLIFLAEDKSVFAIKTESNSDYLTVENGIIYFGITQMPRSLVFVTPQGAVSANQVLLNASSGNNILEGYIKVDNGSSEVGVTSGGSLQLLTENGNEWVKTGNRYILAQADLGDSKGPVVEKPTSVGPSIIDSITPEIFTAAAAVGLTTYLALQSGDNGKARSPATP